MLIKQEPIRSRVHREFVSTFPCMITKDYGGTHPHHLLRVDSIKGMGLKSCDRWCVPLHFLQHDALHRNGNEVEFFKSFKWDYEDVKRHAIELCKMSPCSKIRGLYE